MLKTLHFGTHLELDWQSQVWRPWLTTLQRHHTLIRYDPRGCGLSDHDVEDFSFDRHLDDVDAVLQACQLRRSALFGMTGGAAVAVAFAAEHPERVSRMVLHGGFLRGRMARSTTLEAREETETLLRIVEVGWGKDDPSFRQLYSSQFLPDGTPEQFRSFNELLRVSASPHNAARFLRTLHAVDLSSIAPKVCCPTLVMHARQDTRVPFEEGRALAAAIPTARLVPLHSRNHLLLEHEPAWPTMLSELEGFLSGRSSDGTPGLPSIECLTSREHEVLELVAQGVDNRAIGVRLNISEKTVRNHVSRLLDKLGVPTRSQAIVLARESGFGHASLRDI